jgi:hypothetical protein
MSVFQIEGQGSTPCSSTKMKVIISSVIAFYVGFIGILFLMTVVLRIYWSNWGY